MFACGPALLTPVYVPVGISDPYFANVTLLLHGEGANGSTSILDSSASPNVISAFGDAKLSTAVKMTGSASIALDGVGDYLTSPTGSHLNFGTGDFTIEFGCRLSNFTDSFALARWSATTGNCSWLTAITASSFEFAFRKNDGSSYVATVKATGLSISTGVFYRFAVCRTGTTYRLFLDGVLIFTVVETSIINENVAKLIIGSPFDTGASCMNGYIDEVRITKGVSRYSSSYTPDVAAFPDF